MQGFIRLSHLTVMTRRPGSSAFVPSARMLRTCFRIRRSGSRQKRAVSPRGTSTLLLLSKSPIHKWNPCSLLSSVGYELREALTVSSHSVHLDYYVNSWEGTARKWGGKRICTAVGGRRGSSMVLDGPIYLGE